ncbi:hypothetical protein EDD22DRAFT_846818 [Suillus occidentalis]|nr:hypothetical protein EDD22DRAFT_846818 [Suillus occidentalis]
MTTKTKTAAMDSQELLTRSVPIWPMQLWQYTEITLLREALRHDYTVGMMQVDMPRCETHQDWTEVVHPSGAVYNHNPRRKTYAEMNMRTCSDKQLMRLEAWIDASRKKLNNEEWLLVVEPMLVRGNEIFPYYYVVPEKRIITWLEPVDGYLLFQECKTAWHWNHKRLELEAQYWKHVEYFPRGVEMRIADVKALRIRMNWYCIGKFFRITAPNQNKLIG